MKQRGSISILVLTFGVVISITIATLVLFTATQQQSVVRSEYYQQALGIAEAGVYYYRWHLAHEPTDFTDGTGQSGPYLHEYNDPESGVDGSFELEIIAPEPGSQIVTIISTGWINSQPNIRRTVTARFGPEPLTKYSFLHNANVWFGQGITVYGEIFSNGGIRFDGINESTVRSSRATYTCGTETGCSPSRTRPGVWGSGGPSELWEYPVPVFDFDSVITDFSKMKAAAQASGHYRGPSGAYGYHLRFYADGTFRVYRVTSAQNRRGSSAENGCENLYQHISGETLLGTYQVANNNIIYLEDTVWVEGTVRGDTTVVAARLPAGTYSTNAWIPNSIQYTTTDGSDNLGVIAQNNIYFGLNVPDNFVIQAALMAQSGRIMRHNYNVSGCSTYSTAVRDSMSIWGSVISNQKSYWNFMSGSTLRSGFEVRDITYNQQAADTPPPYFPTTEQLRILSWDEE